MNRESTIKLRKPQKRNAAGLAIAAMAALFVGLAVPASAAPSGPDYDAFDTQPTQADAHGWWKDSQNPYGGYQNDRTRQSAPRR